MKIEDTDRNTEFIKEIESLSGEKIAMCYQCGKCSAGCPIAYEMNELPDKIMRLAQLGMKEELLSSTTPWLCASCEMCSTRCPQEVEIPRVMEAIRAISVREGRQRTGKDVNIFYDTFINNIKTFGRSFEPMMVARFNLSSRKLFKDMKNGMKLFTKGKIGLLPDKPKGMDQIRKIYDRANAEEK